jgi:hypothetical protein
MKETMNKLDKFTYGNTPAAIYLAEHLNTAGTQSLRRKVTRSLTGFNEMVNGIERSNEAGLLTAHTVGALVAALRERVKSTRFDDAVRPEDEDPLVLNLITNLMMGRLKDLGRRVQMVRVYEQQQARAQGPTIKHELDRQIDRDRQSRVHSVLGTLSTLAASKPLSAVQDPIKADTLIERSKRRLDRLNKPNTLY